MRHLDNVVANLRRQLSAEYSPAEPPERLAEALLSLDLQPNQRAHVHEALETFVAYERAACAALVEQAVSKWSAEHPDDSIPVRAYIDDLKKIGEEMRARGRSRSSGR